MRASSPRRIDPDRDLFAESALQQPDDVADEIVDRDPLRLQRLAPRESQQAAGQVGAAQGRVEGLRDEFAVIGL